MDQKKINKILLELESGYDLVSDKFSATRSFFWRDFEFLESYVEKGDRILDFGCGNGRLLSFLKDKLVHYTGVDVSGQLIRIAQEKHSEARTNFLKITSHNSLPFPDNFFNKIFSVAVFHHFPEEHAALMAKELYRVLQSDGIAVVTVWNLWQRNKVKYVLKSLWRLNFKNVYIPFRDNAGNVFSRYHRAYTKSELRSVFEKAGFTIESVEVINGKNIVLVARK